MQALLLVGCLASGLILISHALRTFWRAPQRYTGLFFLGSITASLGIWLVPPPVGQLLDHWAGMTGLGLVAMHTEMNLACLLLALVVVILGSAQGGWRSYGLFLGLCLVVALPLVWGIARPASDHRIAQSLYDGFYATTPSLVAWNLLVAGNRLYLSVFQLAVLGYMAKRDANRADGAPVAPDETIADVLSLTFACCLGVVYGLLVAAQTVIDLCGGGGTSLFPLSQLVLLMIAVDVSLGGHVVLRVLPILRYLRKLLSVAERERNDGAVRNDMLGLVIIFSDLQRGVSDAVNKATIGRLRMRCRDMPPYRYRATIEAARLIMIILAPQPDGRQWTSDDAKSPLDEVQRRAAQEYWFLSDVYRIIYACIAPYLPQDVPPPSALEGWHRDAAECIAMEIDLGTVGRMTATTGRTADG